MNKKEFILQYILKNARITPTAGNKMKKADKQIIEALATIYDYTEEICNQE